MLPVVSLAHNPLKDTKSSPKSSLHPLSEAKDVHKVIYSWGTWPIRNLDGPKHKSSALLRKSKHKHLRFDFCAVNLNFTLNINQLF